MISTASFYFIAKFHPAHTWVREHNLLSANEMFLWAESPPEKALLQKSQHSTHCVAFIMCPKKKPQDRDYGRRVCATDMLTQGNKKNNLPAQLIFWPNRKKRHEFIYCFCSWLQCIVLLFIYWLKALFKRQRWQSYNHSVKVLSRPINHCHLPQTCYLLHSVQKWWVIY